jgi:hypothetical protein
MAEDIKESDLLLPFETKKFWPEYSEYLKTRRQNFFATIQELPLVWECFRLLDQIWMREFADSERVHDLEKMFPGILFRNAHAKFRVAFELAFSCCLGEAWDTLRGAIESVAHAHKIVREPKLLKVWIEKEDGKQQLEAYKEEFERNKKANLFPPVAGLDKLHEHYSHFSEWGTHTTIGSLAQRFKTHEEQKDVEWRLIYTGADPKLLATSLFSMLQASALMENILFSTFRDRLSLDTRLSDMRDELAKQIERARVDIINRFKIAPPTILPVTF